MVYKSKNTFGTIVEQKVAANKLFTAMKNKILLVTSVLILLCLNLSSRDTKSNSSIGQDSLRILCSPDLYDLSEKWALEYNRLFPEVKFSVQKFAGAKAIDIGSEANLGMVSQSYFNQAGKESMWKEVVGRDVFVPVMNKNNPFLKEIMLQGISAEDFAMLFSAKENMNWGKILTTASSAPFTYYFIENESVKASVAGFIGTNPVEVNSKSFESASSMVAAIQKDPLALGFCRLTDILDYETQEISENLSLVPVDRNNNGKLDSNENIYNDLNTFTRGIWIGKFPKTLYSNIYTLANSKPVDETEQAFVKWLLTEGQQYIIPNGYVDLAVAERKSKVEQLIAGNVDFPAPAGDKSNLRLILFILAALVVSGFVLDALIRFLRNKKFEASLTNSAFESSFSQSTVSILNGLFFDKSHTWAYMEKDGLVKIGMDDFLQHVVGSITQLEMKKPGEKIKKGEPLISLIQKGKKLTINAPVSGIIKEQNDELLYDSSLVNSAPYGEGWMYLIEPTNWSKEIPFLLMGEKYSIWLKNEFSRLKDFLASYVKPNAESYSQVVMQDGGELRDKLLSGLGPEVWEDFQSNFINTSK